MKKYGNSAYIIVHYLHYLHYGKETEDIMHKVQIMQAFSTL